MKTVDIFKNEKCALKRDVILFCKYRKEMLSNFRSYLIKENRQRKKANRLCKHGYIHDIFLSVKGRVKILEKYTRHLFSRNDYRVTEKVITQC